MPWRFMYTSESMCVYVYLYVYIYIYIYIYIYVDMLPLKQLRFYCCFTLLIALNTNLSTEYHGILVLSIAHLPPNRKKQTLRQNTDAKSQLLTQEILELSIAPVPVASTRRPA